MANHQVPRKAARIERVHGFDDGGNVVTLSVYEHTRYHHAQPMFYVVIYREVSRRIDMSSRVTRQFTGQRARERMEADMVTARALLAESFDQFTGKTR